jgi:hypothetical protein
MGSETVALRMDDDVTSIRHARHKKIAIAPTIPHKCLNHAGHAQPWHPTFRYWQQRPFSLSR